MKKTLLLHLLWCFIGFYATSIQAQNLTMGWANHTGSAGGDAAYAVALDAQGNVYTTGYFTGGVTDFDPNPNATFNLSGSGSFISKFDINGNFIWVKQIPGYVKDITIDASNNVFLNGYFSGISDFDPNIGVFNMTASGNDMFVLKLDTSGGFVWAKMLYGVVVSNVGGGILKL